MQRVHSHYENLKVSRDAPPEVIKAAFDSLIAKYHPDVNSDTLNAARIIRIVRRSYGVLSDPAQRSEHDRWIATVESGRQQSTANASFPRFETVGADAKEWKWKWKWIASAVVLATILTAVTAEFATRRSAPAPVLVSPATTQPAAPAPVPSIPPPPPGFDFDKPPKKPVPAATPSEYGTPSTINKYVFVNAPGSGPQTSEIDKVLQSGKYTALPPAEVVSEGTGSGPAHLSVINRTGYTLTLKFYGSTDRSIEVAADQSAELVFEPGPYQELGRVSNPIVLPLVGKDNYAPGAGYTATYTVHVVVP